MKIINVIVTSGGTKEYLDDVRVLTNVSSGALGALIAETFANKNKLQRDTKYKIHYVYGKGCIVPFNKSNKLDERNDINLYEVTDVKDLIQTLTSLVPTADIIIHAMAVSDFGFRKTNVKLKSNDPAAFIASLSERIYKNPKVLSHLRTWSPDSFIVSFKFEVGISHTELVRIAFNSLEENKCDLVVANDKKEMTERKSHIAYIIDKKGNEIICNDKISIATTLVSLIEKTKSYGEQE